MQTTRLIAVALVLCLASQTVFASNVVELTPENVDEKIASGKWFIEFYAPWCGFCQRLEPLWEEFATESVGTDVNVAKVNCDEHRMLCRRFDVGGFPTLKLIANQKLYDYPEEGNRDVEAFKKFSTTEYSSTASQDVPTGNSMLDPLIAFAEVVVMDLLAVYEHTLIPGVLILLGAMAVAIFISLFTVPLLVGFGPSFIVPRTIYVLRRPGQPPVIVSEPSKYTKIKTN
jgi:protein disulfide-isomerase-like protein